MTILPTFTILLPIDATKKTDMARKKTLQPGRPRLYKTASERQAAYRARAMRGEVGIAAKTDDPGQGACRLRKKYPQDLDPARAPVAIMAQTIRSDR